MEKSRLELPVIHCSHTVRSFWFLSKLLITPHNCPLISATCLPARNYSPKHNYTPLCILAVAVFFIRAVDFYFHSWTSSDLPRHIYTTYCSSICYISFAQTSFLSDSLAIPLLDVYRPEMCVLSPKVMHCNFHKALLIIIPNKKLSKCPSK